MKQFWIRFVTRIDALSLRERFIVFVMAVLVVLMSVNAIVLDPLYAKHKLLSEQLKQDRAKTADIQQQLQQKLRVNAIDPDEANRAQLMQLKKQIEQMQNALIDMQKGLVPPDKMAALLEDILKRNGQLRLLSLKTLPVTVLNESESAVAQTAVTNKGAAASTPTNSGGEKMGTVYKHGVEITMQGGYLDMMNYMVQLESMPWQVFWGKAKLSVDEYPKATLTLTLYTLSLDKKWLKL
jgi:MSHA biogenesis protein MshJ